MQGHHAAFFATVGADAEHASHLILREIFARQFAVVGIGAIVLFQSQATRAANPRVKEVVVVFKTHFDIGFTALVTNVLTRYRTTFGRCDEAD